MKNRKIILTAALCAALLAMSSCGQKNTSGASTSEAAASVSATETTSATEEAKTDDTTKADSTTAAEENTADSGDTASEGYFSKGIYAAVKNGEIDSLYYFEDAASGHTETFDGNSGLPFSYEQNFDEVAFHFGSPDDTSKMSVHPDDKGYTVGKFENSGDEYTFTFIAENDGKTVTLPEAAAEDPFVVPGVYAGVNNGEFMNLYVFEDETHGKEVYLGGTAYPFTYEINNGKIIFTNENGEKVPVDLRMNDYLETVGEYEGSGAVVTFRYVRGADAAKVKIAEDVPSEESEPAHPFQATDIGWEMMDVPEKLMDMNAVAGGNNAFMLQLDKNAVKNGFEAHFIFLDSQGLIIADHKVLTDKVEDQGIAPAKMLGGMDIVVYPVSLREIIDTYSINLQDVARFYIAEDPENPCIQLVTIEQH